MTISQQCGAMLSLFGQQARRSSGTRSLVQRSISLALERTQVFCQLRLFGTADICISGYDEREEFHYAKRRGGAAKGLSQHLATAGGAWEAWRSASPMGKHGSYLPLKVSEVLQGLKQATTGLLQPSAFPASIPGPLLFAFPGVSQSASLPQSREHGEGMEEGAWEELRDGLEGLFEGGLWATSVKRKRVTKMRKHKWRKRRKAERQSASRRAN